MITVPLETWVSIGALLGVGLSLAGLLLTTVHSLRTEVKSDIADLRTEVKSDIADLRTVVDRLDNRVYALATQQSPGPLIVPRSRD
ncbi:MAG: hypothetical protein P1U38_12555 [Aeromicrobium sp.]|uniref:hypothetical protein n=1 Tax=Aeromicrobium sp. TaxID=1871063 RepID=UPI002638287A|nr:hypothetical protein [Aeromicrobium sp.]MDF1705595.1 hypothetical protein [Aeromicrobium sp.]